MGDRQHPPGQHQSPSTSSRSQEAPRWLVIEGRAGDGEIGTGGFQGAGEIRQVGKTIAFCGLSCLANLKLTDDTKRSSVPQSYSTRQFGASLVMMTSCTGLSRRPAEETRRKRAFCCNSWMS